ncbi:10952_t:CDS:1, partial [Funneliformis geosporum]
PVQSFSGKTDKNPNDWLIHFEKADKANNWTLEKALEIVGGFLEEMVADWYEDTNFQ